MKNMKKFYLFAAITVCLAGAKVYSEMFRVPEGNTAQPAFVDYGGTKYSVGNFNSNIITADTGTIVFQAVYFSSGNAGSYDFVDIWDSSSTTSTTSYTAGSPTLRLYNTNGSTMAATSGNLASSASGAVYPRYPVRLRRGLLWKASSSGYNSILIQYWKQED